MWEGSILGHPPPRRRGAAFRPPLTAQQELRAWQPFVRDVLSAAAPLSVEGPVDVNLPMAWHGFRGVAVVVHQNRCSKS